MTKHVPSGTCLSQAVVCSGLVHMDGQFANDLKADLKGLTHDVLAMIDALLAEAGTAASRLGAVNVFPPQIGDFEAMNSVYDPWLVPAYPPSRACAEARPVDRCSRIEMTAVAAA